MKNRTMYMIGNAHIDPVWLWQWQEGFHEVRATFRSALDRMKEYDEFVFVASSAAFYAWVEESDPEMFEEIKQRVAEGRWVLVGGWWVEPDCNIPGGESFVRHGLYGQRYFQSRFGKIAQVGFNVDSFGHAATLPQILKKSGIPYYAFLRPQPHEMRLPGRVFWWAADDGSRVLAYRIPYEYLSNGRDLEPHVRRCAAEMKPPLNEFMCFYGVGNHGGGPTKENLDGIRRLQGDAELPELRMASPEAFFHSVETRGSLLPVVQDELQHHACGCYAAHSGIKRLNQLAENRLMSAEKWSTLAWLVIGQRYPTNLEHAWKNVLFNQFHDIMAGTSLEIAYEDARNDYGEALAIADRAFNLAVQSFAWNVNIPAELDTRPVVVFNPHAWPVKANVELEFGTYRGDILLDHTGQQVALQRVQSLATAGGRSRLSFIADVPPLGYQLYRVAARPPTREFPVIHAEDLALESEAYRLEFDPKTGAILRLRDKKNETDVFNGLAALPVVLDDTSDTWSHDVFRYDRVAGEFEARDIRLIEHGPVKSVIQVTSTYGASRLIQRFSMFPDLERIEVDATVDWHEQFKLLKLRFPINVRNVRVTYEIPYGSIERQANGDEEPMQSWVDVSGVARDTERLQGFSLLSEGKYSVDVNVRDIGLTVLRSPIYAHHVPALPEEGRLYSFMDQGTQHFRYVLCPHAGGWESVSTFRLGAELRQPLVGLVGTYHPDGKLPARDSFLSVEPANMIVPVVKKAEDGEDLIVRVVETTRAATHATVRLPKWDRVIEADFAPSEIKTFLIPRDPALPIVETDLLERTLP